MLLLVDSQFINLSCSDRFYSFLITNFAPEKNKLLLFMKTTKQFTLCGSINSTDVTNVKSISPNRFKSVLKASIFFLSFFATSYGFSQSTSEWSLAQDNGTIKVYSQVVDCTTGKTVILKVENTGDVATSFVLDIALDIDGRPFMQPGRMISVAANSTSEGVCDRESNHLSVRLPFPGQQILVNVNLN